MYAIWAGALRTGAPALLFAPGESTLRTAASAGRDFPRILREAWGRCTQNTGPQCRRKKPRSRRCGRACSFSDRSVSPVTMPAASRSGARRARSSLILCSSRASPPRGSIFRHFCGAIADRNRRARACASASRNCARSPSRSRQCMPAATRSRSTDRPCRSTCTRSARRLRRATSQPLRSCSPSSAASCLRISWISLRRSTTGSWPSGRASRTSSSSISSKRSRTAGSPT